ncbi:3,4-dihydroxy-2-butanone-4-phosphate synthase [Halobacteriales archaeon QH_2_66_30]|nr:MAG: 3,4-dihydroxy-2-butanone-4-phosphate synthase [Halobacteriales archaeon QH_2_66_30]
MSRSSDATGTASGVEAAVNAFQRGQPVCIHDADDREGETDLIYPAHAVTPAAVARLRNDAGGLVCVAVSDAVAEAFGLPFLEDALDHPAAEDHDLRYDDRSSFSLPVNHRDTDTGITDEDRALTIRALASAAAAPERTDFALGVALAEAADVPPAVVVCEMLDDETGGALSPADAALYAESHGIPYLEGAAIVERLG